MNSADGTSTFFVSVVPNTNSDIVSAVSPWKDKIEQFSLAVLQVSP